MLGLKIRLDPETFEALAFAAVRSDQPMPTLAGAIIRAHFDAIAATEVETPPPAGIDPAGESPALTAA